MKCPECNAAELVHGTRDQLYTYKGNTTTISAVTGDFCPVCNESLTALEETQRIMTLMQAFSKQVDEAQADPV
jgi:HTH-type transcriptional regulator/antitoxin MqsA